VHKSWRTPGHAVSQRHHRWAYLAQPSNLASLQCAWATYLNPKRLVCPCPLTGSTLTVLPSLPASGPGEGGAVDSSARPSCGARGTRGTRDAVRRAAACMFGGAKAVAVALSVELLLISRSRSADLVSTPPPRLSPATPPR
jgi:hypothetical protein